MLDHRRPAARASLAVVLAAVLLLVGCAPTTAPGPSPSPTATTGAATFGDADVTFAQMMIPHHEQAVQMSDLLLTKPGVRSDVADLAGQIKAAQQPEIATMQGWLVAWGKPASGGMEMGTGGMLTQEQLDALAQADTAAGQSLYLEGMVKHHRGAVQMAQDEIANGQNPDAVALARTIVRTQQAEIGTMEKLLATL